MYVYFYFVHDLEVDWNHPCISLVSLETSSPTPFIFSWLQVLLFYLFFKDRPCLLKLLSFHLVPKGVFLENEAHTKKNQLEYNLSLSL